MSTEILKARCGKCQSRLRIPAAWLQQAIRCTRCGTAFRVERRRISSDQPATVASLVEPPTTEVAENADHNFFADLAAQPNPIAFASGVTYRPTNAWAGWAMAGIVLFVIIASGFAYLFRDRLFSSPAQSKIAKADVPEKNNQATVAPLPVTAGPFPRRMLAISINQYLYANPILFGSPRRSVAALLDRMAEKYRIPKDQLFLLTDAPSNRASVPPLKPILKATIEQFLTTARPQDRIVLLYAGHAVVLDGKAYLVPLEGELGNKESLLPFDWLYEQLAACKARQKILVFDACRSDPGRGNERPSPGPMDPALEKLLKNPPAGLQVWSACAANQVSFEYKYQAFDGYEIEGSLFLNQFFNAFTRFGAGIPKPEDAIPLGPLASTVNDLTKAAAQGVQLEAQTPFLAGAEREGGSAYDAAESPPERVVIPKPAQFAPGGLADLKLVKEILNEIRLPPIKAVAPTESRGDDIDAIVPFSAEALKGYDADYGSVREILDKPDQHQLRVAVLRTIEILERHGRGEVRLGNTTKQVGTLREEFSGPSADDVKKDIALEQREGPAAMFVELEDALAALEKMKPLRAQETSKRWQAHYDYVLAMLSARFAYVNEYNLMLGKIRKDELPPLDPKLHRGWRLAAQEKMASPRDVKDKAEEAKKLFESLIKEHPGTPWEVLAKRERLTALGLSWQPTAVKN